MVHEVGADTATLTYYALMSDGTLNVWSVYHPMWEPLIIISFTIYFSVLAAIIVSAFYAGVRVGKRGQKGMA